MEITELWLFRRCRVEQPLFVLLDETDGVVPRLLAGGPNLPPIAPVELWGDSTFPDRPTMDGQRSLRLLVGDKWVFYVSE